MNKTGFTLRAVALLVFTLALTSLAQAQSTRTWVSGVGDDINPCSRTAPCKTFPTAMSKTASGGEINALDPGGFGTITINKSITIDGGGVHAGIAHSGGINGIVINDSLTAPGTIKVVLRNIALNGGGTATLGLNGIRFVSGKSVHVENVRIQNVSGDGINITSTATGTVNINIVETIISNAGGSAINMASASGVVNVSINHSMLKDCGNGLTNAVGTANIRNSVVSGNTSNGIQTTTNQAVINATSNSVTDNGASGILAAAGSTVRIDDNKVFRNLTGLNNNGTMETWQNNEVRGNTTDVGGGFPLASISGIGVGTR